MRGYAGLLRGVVLALALAHGAAAAEVHVPQRLTDGGVLHYKRIDEIVAGDHEQVAGVAGQVIRVYVIKLYCQGNNTIYLKDTTPRTLDGPIDFNGTAATFLGNQDQMPHYVTGIGQGLLFTTTTNGDCNGFLWYTQGP